MLAAVLHNQNDLRIEDVRCPEISDDEVLLRSRAASICGTDMRIYRYGHSRLPAKTKRILGHEMAGEVVKTGKNVKGLKEGMRVAVAPNFGCGMCRMCQRGWFHLCAEYGAIGLTVDGGFAEYVRVPKIALQQGCLLQMSEDLSFEQAALNEPFACVYNGFERCRLEIGDIVLIVGSGPIGVMHILLARLAGASKIVVADVVACRLDLAGKLGADATINSKEQNLKEAVMELTDGDGADYIVTACPAPQVQEQVMEIAAEHARINFFGGLPKGEEHISFNSNLVHYKELTVTGSHGCCTYHCQKTLELQNSKAIDLKPLITNVFNLSEIDKAFEAAMAGKGLKTVVKP